MKPTTPHDPLDDLIAAALHGDLTSTEHAQLESRLQNDPAAKAAYQKAQLMHDLLEKTHREAQPDPAFEQRMISGVRRKIQDEKQHRESAWESLAVLWPVVKGFLARRRWWHYAATCAIVAVLLFGLVTYEGRQVTSVFATINSQLTTASSDYGHAEIINGSGFEKPQLSTSSVADAEERQKEISKEDDDVDIFRNKSIRKGAEFGGVDAKQPMFNSSLPGAPGDRPQAGQIDDLKKKITDTNINYAETAKKGITLSGYVDPSYTYQFAGKGEYANSDSTAADTDSSTVGNATITPALKALVDAQHSPPTSPAPLFLRKRDMAAASPTSPGAAGVDFSTGTQGAINKNGLFASNGARTVTTQSGFKSKVNIVREFADAASAAPSGNANTLSSSINATFQESTPSIINRNVSNNIAAQVAARTITGLPVAVDAQPVTSPPSPTKPAPDTTAEDIGRKLIRNAELELEVKSFQIAMDEIGTLTREAGGYVDTNNSQRGGNGKLQGTVVVKVLPKNLDDFLLKLRDLGDLKNQMIKTDDVTKAYFDTQSRLNNSRRMEEQLLELLKHDNGKVSDLLLVERELGRVRGEIEQMQGDLKVYDFQVQYATVTMQVREKDLNQTAAYLLKEQDNFSLFATNVEDTFQQARHAADDVKAQILQADLHHNSGSDVTADIEVMVAPDQIETFLTQIRTLGRVDNFTRETQRVAKDGGDSDQPADQTLTEKDKVEVHLSIRSDDESRKQMALTVITKTVDDALEKAKASVLGSPGAEIISSSLNKAPEGQSVGQLKARVPGKNYQALLDTLRTLGRPTTFSLQRDDNSGPGSNGDDAPVIISLSLTDEETPLQQTDMSVLASGVDEKAQQIKAAATTSGVEIKASTFQRQPNGMEVAQMTFRLPMSKYPAFVESLKNLGKVESLTVQREDRPDQASTDETAPVDIRLFLHNQGDVVPDSHGLWATLRQTFGQGVGALFASVATIGVMAAYLAPWVLVLIFAAWVGRRIYLWRRK